MAPRQLNPDCALHQVGELRFTVVPAEEAATDAAAGETAPFLVAVRRQGASGPLPGEDRILRSFRAVCRRHRAPAGQSQQAVRLSARFLRTWTRFAPALRPEAS